MVEHRAQREHVAARVELLAAHLLGAHVEHRANEHALLGDGRLAARARDAEVEQLHGAVVQHHDVRGLEVAVDQPVAMHERQRVRHLQRDAQRLLEAEQLVLDDAVERAALEILHGDVALALELAVLVDRGDARVHEVRRVARLALEALVRLGVDLHVGAQDLERHRALEPNVARAVHRRQRALAEPVLDRVVLEVGEAALVAGLGHRGRGSYRPLPPSSLILGSRPRPAPYTRRKMRARQRT